MPGPSKWRRREFSVAVVFVDGEGVESGGDGDSSTEDDEGDEGEEEEVEKDDHGEVAVAGLAANGGGDKDAPGMEEDAPVDDDVLRE